MSYRPGASGPNHHLRRHFSPTRLLVTSKCPRFGRCYSMYAPGWSSRALDSRHVPCQACLGTAPRAGVPRMQTSQGLLVTTTRVSALI